MTTAPTRPTNRLIALRRNAKIDGYQGYAPDLRPLEEARAALQAAQDEAGHAWTDEERTNYLVWFFCGWYLKKRGTA
jgi:hypothetical protein